MAKKSYSDKLKDPRWQKKRLEILERDGWSCLFCGDDEATLHVHHISRHGEPWETPNTHLITLCSECHLQEEKDLNDVKQSIFGELQKCGFVSDMLNRIPSIFIGTDRGWKGYEPAIDILKMVVDDDDIWNMVADIFYDKLHKKHK